MMSMLLNGLAGMTLSQSLGTLSWGLYGSQEMVVICDELVRMIKRILDGITVNEETLAVDVIRQVGYGDNYLGHDHTLKLFCKDIYFPSLFHRQTIDEWINTSGKMIDEVAHERVLEILAKAGPVQLPEGADLELERALRRAVEETEKAAAKVSWRARLGAKLEGNTGSNCLWLKGCDDGRSKP